MSHSECEQANKARGASDVPGQTDASNASVPVADLLRLAHRIESEHADGRFCACCSTDAQYIRDLAARYSKSGGSS